MQLSVALTKRNNNKKNTSYLSPYTRRKSTRSIYGIYTDFPYSLFNNAEIGKTEAYKYTNTHGRACRCLIFCLIYLHFVVFVAATRRCVRLCACSVRFHFIDRVCAAEKLCVFLLSSEFITILHIMKWEGHQVRNNIYRLNISICNFFVYLVLFCFAFFSKRMFDLSQQSS